MTFTLPYGGSSLVYAATGAKHRPASHPLLRGIRPSTPTPWATSLAQWERAQAKPSAEHEAELRRLLA